MLVHLILFIYTTLVGAVPTWLDTAVVRTFEEGDEPEEQPGSSGFWLKIGISGLFIVLGGFFAGWVGSSPD